MSFEWVGSKQISAGSRPARGWPEAFVVAAALVATAVLTALPAALGPVRLNDSFWIDLVWLEQFARELGQGTLYPRWLPLSHGGLGSPVFYYYPPLAFYAASAFVLLGLSTYSALVAAFCTLNFLSGCGVYLWLKGQSRGALFAAMLFMVAPYHLFNFYQRGAIAEFMATAILPFVLLGIRRITEGRRGAFAFTAIAFSALIMSHLPLTLLASLFLFAPYALVSSWRSPPTLLRIGATFACGVALAAVYLVPAFALEQYRSSADLWALPYLHPANWTVWSSQSWAVATFDAVMVVAGGVTLALISLLLCQRSGWAVGSLACTALAVGLLPFVWSLPLLRSVQFPFRLLPIAELGMVTAAALAPRGRTPWLVLAAIVLILARLITTAAPDSPPFGDKVIREYHPDVPENLPPGQRPYSWPSKWALQLSTEHRQPQFDGKVTVEPVFYFPAWQVRCAGSEVATFPAPKTELLAHEGSGCSRSLVSTSAEKVGAAISLAALLLLLSSLLSPALLGRHRWRRRESRLRNT